MVANMARITKAELEKKVEELEKQLADCQKWLMESENKYSQLAEVKEEEFKKLPLYENMEKAIERLEFVKSQNENTIRHKEKTEIDLRNKIQELLEENKQLKESAKNQTVINGSIHNARGAGRKPKPDDITRQQLCQIESYLADRKTGKEISALMGISERTFYRLKRLAKEKPRN